MGLFGSLYTGASGLMAQSRSTEVISTNIANANTVGYKRNEVSFGSLLGDVSGRSSTSKVATGGVMATPISRVREQGTQLQTSSTTDVSISGNGFFVVSKEADGTGEFLYTRAGQFNEDNAGILRNTAGFALYGYATDAEGNATGTGEAGLVPIDLSLVQTASFETSEIELAMNLDSNEAPLDPHQVIPAQQLPISNLRAPDYSRDVTIYDADGIGQDIRIEYRRTVGPMAHFTSDLGLPLSRTEALVDNINGPTPSLTAGDNLSISDGTDTLDITFVNGAADLTLNQANTFGDVLDLINNYTGSGTEPLFVARVEDNQLLVQSTSLTSTLDITGSNANTLSAFRFIQDPDATPDYIYEPDFDITATPDATSAYPGQGDFPALLDTTTANPYSWWEVTVNRFDGLTGTNTQITQGLVNFDSSGRLNTTRGAAVDNLITLSQDDLPFNSSSDISIDVTRLTQFSGVYETIDIAQNGAPATNATGISIEQDGTVILQFASDLRRPVYKIPLARFTNPEGLTSVDGTAYRVGASSTSGPATLVDARSDGVGSILSSTLENANVDIGSEFGDLIVTQRSYSMNSQLIQAVNEMTQTLNQLKR